MHSPLFFVKKTSIVSKAFMLLISFSLFFCGCLNSSVNIEDSNENLQAERTSYMMNTIVMQRWYGEKAEETCDEIEDALSNFENIASLYIEDSEVNQINEAAGKDYVKVSDVMFEMLSEAKMLCEESDGAFDITIGPLVLLWDITGQSGDPHVPDRQDIGEAITKIDYTKLLLNEEGCSIMLAEEGMKLDLGGAAKGYAAALMKSIAEKNGVSGYLSVGGNMLVIGKKPDGEEFDVGVRDPLRDSNSYFAVINIDGYTMASSSAAEIYFEEDGKVYHHILDPATGYPGETDLLQVSVISKNGLLADALSTTIFLKGSECLEEYMNRDDCMILAVTEDQKVYGSEDIWEMLTPYNTDDYTFMQP